MGTAIAARQGLRVRTRKVAHREVGFNAPLVEKFSEVSLVMGDRWPGDVVDATPAIHEHGLKIGMNFRRLHCPVLSVAAGDADHPAPETLAYTGLIEVPRVTRLLNGAFSSDGRWRGYEIPPGAVSPAPSGQTSLYFNTRLYGFQAHSALDVHFVPIVAIMGNLSDFTQHYALGVGVFSLGKDAKAFEFDTEVFGAS